MEAQPDEVRDVRQMEEAQLKALDDYYKARVPEGFDVAPDKIRDLARQFLEWGVTDIDEQEIIEHHRMCLLNKLTAMKNQDKMMDHKLQLESINSALVTLNDELKRSISKMREKLNSLPPAERPALPPPLLSQDDFPDDQNQAPLYVEVSHLAKRLEAARAERLELERAFTPYASVPLDLDKAKKELKELEKERLALVRRTENL